MAGMALLLVCAVTADEGGWRASDRNGQQVARPDQEFNDRPAKRPDRVDLPGTLPGRLPPDLDTPTSANAVGRPGRDWADIEDALRRPVDRNARSSDGYSGLRRAGGADTPPQPPTFGPPAGRGRVREWLESGTDGGQQRAADQIRSDFDNPERDLDPRDSGRQPRVRQPRARQQTADDGLMDVPDLPPPGRQSERDLLFEQRLADNRDDRRYLTPPPREIDDRRSRTDDVIPVPSDGRRDPPRRDETASALPSGDLPLNSPNNFASDDEQSESPSMDVKSPSDDQGPAGSSQPPDSAADEKKGAVTARSWWPLMLAMVGLFGSIGFNLYLGWIAWDMHGRYQDVVDEVRELESQLDERQPRSESSKTHRIRA